MLSVCMWVCIWVEVFYWFLIVLLLFICMYLVGKSVIIFFSMFFRNWNVFFLVLNRFGNMFYLFSGVSGVFSVFSLGYVVIVVVVWLGMLIFGIIWMWCVVV